MYLINNSSGTHCSPSLIIIIIIIIIIIEEEMKFS
jgi:hypothetical protein